MMMHRRRSTVLALGLSGVVLGLVGAGCGGGTPAPGIASVASSTPAATTTTQSNSGTGDRPLSLPGGGAGQRFSLAMRVGSAADGAKFSACMRKHGVTSFPDPNSQGVIAIHSGMGIDPGSPTFQSARTTCDKLLPNGGQPTPQQQAQREQQMLAFSRCMRAHGIKDFPDPSNGGIRIHAGQGSDLNPQNPQFQKAQQACQGNLPFKTAATGSGPR